MKLIQFECHAQIAKPPAEIASEVSDLARWVEFKGYGFLPGIKLAEYETRTETMVGSRILVLNLDGSIHVEEILVWEPETRILMKLHEFSPPLSRLASHFTEEWLFGVGPSETHVIRRFEMYPHNWIARPILSFIAGFFRKAIDRQLDQMRLDAQGG